MSATGLARQHPTQIRSRAHVPIPDTTKLHRLDESLGAANGQWTPDDLRDLESAAAKIKVEGARYAKQLEPLTGR